MYARGDFKTRTKNECQENQYQNYDWSQLDILAMTYCQEAMLINSGFLF